MDYDVVDFDYFDYLSGYDDEPSDINKVQRVISKEIKGIFKRLAAMELRVKKVTLSLSREYAFAVNEDFVKQELLAALREYSLVLFEQRKQIFLSSESAPPYFWRDTPDGM